MNTTLGVIMDPIESIKVQKDSTFAMLLAAQHRGWELLYMEQGDLRFLTESPMPACAR
ncbi:glutathione synthetase [endosymbiont of Riftia pachyptila (vent Ph05)]|uniref:Glutathione synthetase n=1 Tax=endosymbiont of Riftia pachyptila (vent Ph05) TaxID=1048808 RepID=G2DEI3_9GAMM|nr:glutathione synthetase [endosymbiont of Riftia pachyptila (vent Ph05)]